MVLDPEEEKGEKAPFSPQPTRNTGPCSGWRKDDADVPTVTEPEIMPGPHEVGLSPTSEPIPTYEPMRQGTSRPADPSISPLGGIPRTRPVSRQAR